MTRIANNPPTAINEMKAHPQSIVTPARTGATIGLNRRRQTRPQWATVAAFLLVVAAFAGALGLIAGTTIR
jgi:hypothetical protein